MSERDPLFDGTRGDGDAALEALERTLGVFAHTAPLRELPERTARRGGRRWIAPGVGVALVAVAVVVVVWIVRDRDGERHDPIAQIACTGTGFSFAIASGQATCGGAATGPRGTLAVGAWLETRRDAVARLAVADIGTLEIYGDSKLRLVGTGATQHRLELARGHVSARVSAPPRLFIVDTPAAAAVDLGCAYDLVVDGDGKTHLRVTYGAVSLEGKGGVAYVPAGYEVDFVRGQRAGTPVVIGASAELRAAVARFDSVDGGEPAALAAVVAAAGPVDRMTLWNVIAHTRDAAAVDKLASFAPLPEPSLRAKILAGDADAMAAWRDTLVFAGKRGKGGKGGKGGNGDKGE